MEATPGRFLIHIFTNIHRNMVKYLYDNTNIKILGEKKIKKYGKRYVTKYYFRVMQIYKNLKEKCA